MYESAAQALVAFGLSLATIVVTSGFAYLAISIIKRIFGDKK